MSWQFIGLMCIAWLLLVLISATYLGQAAGGFVLVACALITFRIIRLWLSRQDP